MGGARKKAVPDDGMADAKQAAVVAQLVIVLRFRMINACLALFCLSKLILGRTTGKLLNTARRVLLVNPVGRGAEDAASTVRGAHRSSTKVSCYHVAYPSTPIYPRSSTIAKGAF